MRYRSLAVATLAWILAECPVFAQGRAEYISHVDQYVSGQTTDAVAALAAWPDARVRAAVKSLDGQPPLSPARLRAAVVLHTEAALGEEDNHRELFHLDVARTLVERLLATPRVPPAARDFAARSYAMWAVVYCTRGAPGLAGSLVNRGRVVDGNNPFVNLVAGALLEYRLLQIEPNPRGTWNVEVERTPALKGLLHRAALIYRGIIAGHPEFYEARLRLGVVLAFNDSVDNAREQLEVVAARAERADLAYLAHMFLASLHERARRPADAAREYEAARAAASFQSSLIALIRMAGLRGEGDRVRALAAEVAERPGDEDDPWSVYPLCGITGRSLLDGLRADALRR